MRRARRIGRNRATVSSPSKVVGEAKLNAAIAEISDAVNGMADKGAPYTDVELVTGTNRISHALGRPALGWIVVPRDPDPSFGWGFDVSQLTNAHPDRTSHIEVVGGPMKARLFAF